MVSVVGVKQCRRPSQNMQKSTEHSSVTFQLHMQKKLLVRISTDHIFNISRKPDTKWEYNSTIRPLLLDFSITHECVWDERFVY